MLWYEVIMNFAVTDSRMEKRKHNGVRNLPSLHIALQIYANALDHSITHKHSNA